MPVLQCSSIMEAVAKQLRLNYANSPFSNTNSTFLTHLSNERYLIDKSNIIVDFVDGASKAESNGLDLDLGQSKRSCPRSSSSKAKQRIGGYADHASNEPENYYHRVLILRPPHFGKTLNLSMINDFLRMGDSEVCEYGRKIVFEQTTVWKQYPDFCKENFAKHPVISVTFKVRGILWVGNYALMIRRV